MTGPGDKLGARFQERLQVPRHRPGERLADHGCGAATDPFERLQPTLLVEPGKLARPNCLDGCCRATERLHLVGLGALCFKKVGDPAERLSRLHSPETRQQAATGAAGS